MSFEFDLPDGLPASAWWRPTNWVPLVTQTNKIDAQSISRANVSVPIGGIGTGTLSRSPDGGFTRASLKTGAVHNLDMAVNGFALWQRTEGTNRLDMAALRSAPKDGPMRAWQFRDEGGLHGALFPKAWHHYPAPDGQNVALTIEQISPVAPQLQGDAALPVGVFRMRLENTGNVRADASIMMSFANLVGGFTHFGAPDIPGAVAGQTAALVEEHGLLGILFGRETAEGALAESDGQMVLGVTPELGFEISGLPAFDPARDADRLWRQFRESGTVWLERDEWVSGGGFAEHPAPQICGALAAKCSLQPGQVRTIDFCLVWDFPVVSFGQGRRRAKRYTELYGAEGRAATRIAKKALSEAKNWSAQIDLFHQDLFSRLALPDEQAAFIVNSLHYLVDGGSVWTAGNKKQAAHFALLECPDYPLYNTLDLWIYAAAALRDLWPELSRSVTLDFADAVQTFDESPRHHLLSNAVFQRMVRGAAPHDLGEPREDPWVKANAYVYQDSNRWKDLNSQFVMTAWADARIADKAFSQRILGSVDAAIGHLKQFDKDGDGLIEHEGIPDQTFDNVPMMGPGAYCNGLWLGALEAGARIAERADEGGLAADWRETLKIAQQSFEAKLWSGTHYRLDTGGRYSGALMSEQLFGPALARMLHLGDLIPIERAQAALQTIYDLNFVKAGGGRGLRTFTDAGEPLEGLQRDEILVGLSLSFAAQLRTYGMEDQCQNVLGALTDECLNVRGLGFRLPAAYDPDQNTIRAALNLRTLAGMMLLEARAVP